MKAASFSRCVHYVTGKESTRILASDGVFLTTTQDIIDSFEFQRQMNPRISKPVGHIALSFLPEDKDILTDEMMTKIAREYMKLMGIKDTQFLLVRHFDRSNSVRLLPTGRKNGNPHCHLVYNRINNEGKTILGQNDFRRNEQVTKLHKRKYGLTFSKGKGHTKTERLRGTEKTMVSTNRPKYEIYRIVMNTLAQSTSWKEFMGHLREEGVEMELVMRRKDSRDIKNIQGICFIKDGYTFKASQIKRGMTFGKMDSVIKKNAHKAQQETIVNQPQTRHYELPKEEPNSKQQERNEPSIGIPSLGLFDTNNPVYDPAEEEFRRQMQKKKKKRGPRL